MKSSAVDICSWADVVIVCMSDYARCSHVMECSDVAQALQGRIVIQLAHGTPDQAANAALTALRSSAYYLDGCLLVWRLCF